MIRLLFRVLKQLGGAGILGCFLSVTPAFTQNHVGLWVEAEGQNRPFDEVDKFKEFLGFISEYPFTDFYCQVYRESRSWFPSKLADDGPFQLAYAAGYDPL